jgi:hypothetical protein
MNLRLITKRLHLRFLTALLIFLATPVLAKYSGGSGDPNNPYQIANVADLMTLANDTNDYNKCFIMTADIDLDPCLPGNQVFTHAIFNDANFTGVFDGSESEINNMTIDANQGDLSLFRKIDTGGQVKNLRIKNIRITGDIYIWAYFGGLASYNYGTINNCHTSGTFIGGLYTVQWIGGLAGVNYGNITNCSSIIFTDFNGSEFLGGLVGSNMGNIKNCFTAGDVNGSNYVGGLVGRNYSSISNCFSESTVAGNVDIGGLVGDLYNGNIVNCYATGTVNGLANVGGLVGAQSAAIINCYSSGTVSGSTYVGGLVGYRNYPTFNSYFLSTAGPSNGAGTPLTDSQMKQQASFANWDFVWETANGPNDVWAICEGISYPKLAWQFIPGDFDNNKDVNFIDFAAMGLKWQQADSTLYCGGNDLTGDGFIDLNDLAAFVENWLSGL